MLKREIYTLCAGANFDSNSSCIWWRMLSFVNVYSSLMSLPLLFKPISLPESCDQGGPCDSKILLESGLVWILDFYNYYYYYFEWFEFYNYSLQFLKFFYYLFFFGNMVLPVIRIWFSNTSWRHLPNIMLKMKIWLFKWIGTWKHLDVWNANYTSAKCYNFVPTCATYEKWEFLPLEFALTQPLSLIYYEGHGFGSFCVAGSKKYTFSGFNDQIGMITHSYGAFIIY